MLDTYQLTIDFLYKSIEDAQNTIRAIDIKVGFLFAISIIPMSSLDKIISTFNCLSSVQIGFFWVTIFIWGTSIFILFKTIVGISSPATHILGFENQKGIFYMPALFKFSWIDRLYNSKVQSKMNIEDMTIDIPKDYDEIIKELTFEKMKLSYIRDIKLERSTSCFYLTFSWIVLGGITTIWSKI